MIEKRRESKGNTGKTEHQRDMQENTAHNVRPPESHTDARSGNVLNVYEIES